jgi:large subunit ribosomal protein L4
MPEIPLYNANGEALGNLSLPESVFGVEPNVSLVHQAVVTEEANARQGTADTKTRGEVRGGGKKPYRQKGTGRARQGSTRAPHWRHGGVVFGPHPRSYAKAFPIKMRRGALRSALSGKVLNGQMIGIDALQLDGISTKRVAEVLGKLPVSREVAVKSRNSEGDVVEGARQKRYKVLLIVPEYDPALLLSCRNIPDVTLRYAPNFSVRDVVAAGRVVLAQGAVAKIEEVLGQ